MGFERHHVDPPFAAGLSTDGGIGQSSSPDSLGRIMAVDRGRFQRHNRTGWFPRGEQFGDQVLQGAHLAEHLRGNRFRRLRLGARRFQGHGRFTVYGVAPSDADTAWQGDSAAGFPDSNVISLTDYRSRKPGRTQSASTGELLAISKSQTNS
jgi:hypothetical protein